MTGPATKDIFFRNSRLQGPQFYRSRLARRGGPPDDISRSSFSFSPNRWHLRGPTGLSVAKEVSHAAQCARFHDCNRRRSPFGSAGTSILHGPDQDAESGIVSEGNGGPAEPTRVCDVGVFDRVTSPQLSLSPFECTTGPDPEEIDRGDCGKRTWRGISQCTRVESMARSSWRIAKGEVLCKQHTL